MNIMENITHLKTKFMLPIIPAGSLFSNRIKAMNIERHRAIIITAPAGYGKTTAVLLSLRKYAGSTHWYRIEKEDASLSVFFANLIETLFEHDEKGSDSTRSLTSIGNIMEEYPLLSAVICQDAWSCYAQDDAPQYLVFDDFQHVADNEAICETIRYLMSNMPKNIHIIVISRVNTGIRTEKLALAGEVVTIDDSRLLFSIDETNTLFSDLAEIEATPEYISDAYAYSEGWVSGIMLLIHTINRLKSGDKWALEGNKQDVFHYLLSEALQGIERDRVRQMAMISLLSDFTCEDLSAVFQMDDASSILEWLERHNLYIQKIGTEPPSYRFHSLFQNALQQTIRGEFTDEEITAFHSTAAAHYEKTGRYRAAVQHYLCAQNTQSAINVAAVQGQKYMDKGDIDAAAALVHTLPEQYIHANATLLMILGGSLTNTETDRSFAYLEKALALAVKNGDFVLAIKTQGFTMSVCAQRNDFSSMKKIIAQVPMFRSMMVSKQARKMLLMSLFMKAAVTDQVKLAQTLWSVVDRQELEPGEILWEYANAMSKGTLNGVDGDFREAEKLILQLTGHPTALRNDRWRFFGLNIGINLAILMRETDLALKLIDNLASLGEKYASGYASGNAAYHSGFAKYQNRDFKEAILALENAEKIFVANQHHALASASRALRTAWLAECEPEKNYVSQADAELDTMAALSTNHGLFELAATMAAIAHMHQGSYDKAEALLQKAYKWAKSKRAPQSLCGVAMHLSALYHALGDLKREARYLLIFGNTAAKNGYLFFREMRYDALVRACARCVEKKIAPEHMAKIIGAYFSPAAAHDLLKAPANAANDPRAFIARYPAANPDTPRRVQVKLFGAFSLTLDGREADPDIWKTRKISGILKYILARADTTVSRERLASVFWPDSSPKSAYSSLRVALCELRKALTALGMAFESQDALVSENKNGFYVCRPERVEIDANVFSASYEKIKGLPFKDAKVIYQKMVDMYTGDFLADSTYDEWADVTREYYRSIYIEVSHKLAAHYCAGGDNGRAEALLVKHMTIDPYDEKACRMLIDVYGKSGRQAQASSLRRQFERRFKAEMGFEPELD